ncbi:M13-type metalloendopeptidase [Haloferula sp. BvORR071]|uniref:M13 family metallopeptidase n=1 Tax=Haloferula sp. BvORR071 TaxID=1396141 RepID=UPI00069754AD|nr:M13-type metalloendopeptidase [Haloferula sp. BvORR071]
MHRPSAFSFAFLLPALHLAAICPVSAEAAPEAPSLAAQRFGTWGFDLSGRNLDVKPGDDFYEFANGKFVERTEIPPDRVRIGNFDQLGILSEERVRGILEDAVKNPNPATAKIAAFYAAYMNEERAAKLGSQPLEPELAAIKAAANHAELAGFLGKPDSLSRGLFGVGIGADPKDPARYVVSSSTGGLGLPDRNSYLKQEASYVKTREAYEVYAARLLELVGWPEPAARAKEIMAFETKLAEASWERAEMRDRDKTYNPMSPGELAALVEGYDVPRMLEGSGVAGVGKIVVSDKSAFPKKAKIFAETPLETLKAWAAFGAADSAAPFLSPPFVDASFEFRGKVLTGQVEPLARWKRAVAATNDALGEEVGKAYVAKYFPAESKRQMLDLVANVRKALAIRIDKLDWMNAETKKAAQEKLAKISVKIGYPDVFRDYSAYQVSAEDLLGNIRGSASFGWKRRLDRLNDPVDRNEWGMPPQKVNAYYNSVMNEIVFPAAILQPPFFDPQADPAVNYGGIGGVIGHEISHGFDDQGRKSDGDGVLQDWWTPQDAETFKQRADKLGAQYESIEILPGQHINGKLTMGENIGDMGGITLGLEAYRASLGGKPAPEIDGTTGDQRVFLGWAQVWRQKIRKEALQKQLDSDPHSPAIARVNLVLRNIDAWYDAFKIQPGDKLYVKPEDRVRIW